MFQIGIPVTRKHSCRVVKPKDLLCQAQLQFTFHKKKKKQNQKNAGIFVWTFFEMFWLFIWNEFLKLLAELHF